MIIGRQPGELCRDCLLIERPQTADVRTAAKIKSQQAIRIA